MKIKDIRTRVVEWRGKTVPPAPHFCTNPMDLLELPADAMAGFRFHGWNGVVAPRGTPRAIIVKLNRVMGEVLATAEVRKLFFETGEEPLHGSPEDFGKLIREEYEQMGKLVKLAGVRAE